MHSFLPCNRLDHPVHLPDDVAYTSRRRKSNRTARIRGAPRCIALLVYDRTALPAQSPVYPSIDGILALLSLLVRTLPHPFTHILPYAYRLSFPAHYPGSPHATRLLVLPPLPLIQLKSPPNSFYLILHVYCTFSLVRVVHPCKPDPVAHCVIPPV